MLNIPSEITRMNFKETPEFQKNFKRLRKKYLSLDEDLMEFKKVISLFPISRSKHLAVLMAMKGIKIFKARLFCRYLKGSSLRIVYAFQEALYEIEFIEIYSKNEQETENRRFSIKAILAPQIRSGLKSRQAIPDKLPNRHVNI